MGKITRKCCLGCPAFLETTSFHYVCSLGREIVGERGKISVSIPYSKEPCKRPKTYKEFVNIKMKEGR